MAKKKKNRRRYAKKIPIALTAGFIGTALGGKESGNSVMDHALKGDYKGVIGRLCLNFTGYDPMNPGLGFRPHLLNLEPLIVGAVLSIGASKLGINRRLSALGLPIKL